MRTSRRSATQSGRARSRARSRRSALDPPQVLHKYPHQLSGGQLQRLLVARALLLDIEFLVADEIISMLDASTRIDVLNLLGDLKARGLGILFITHDLSLGNYISDRTVILRRGVVVEVGATDEGLRQPAARLHADAAGVRPAPAPQVGATCEADERPRRLAGRIESDAVDSSLVELEPDHLVRRSRVRAA